VTQLRNTILEQQGMYMSKLELDNSSMERYLKVIASLEAQLRSLDNEDPTSRTGENALVSSELQERNDALEQEVSKLEHKYEESFTECEVLRGKLQVYCDRKDKPVVPEANSDSAANTISSKLQSLEQREDGWKALLCEWEMRGVCWVQTRAALDVKLATLRSTHWQQQEQHSQQVMLLRRQVYRMKRDTALHHVTAEAWSQERAWFQERMHLWSTTSGGVTCASLGGVDCRAKLLQYHEQLSRLQRQLGDARAKVAALSVGAEEWAEEKEALEDGMSTKTDIIRTLQQVDCTVHAAYHS
jgi:hypothetical protein